MHPEVTIPAAVKKQGVTCTLREERPDVAGRLFFDIDYKHWRLGVVAVFPELTKAETLADIAFEHTVTLDTREVKGKQPRDFKVQVSLTFQKKSVVVKAVGEGQYTLSRGVRFTEYGVGKAQDKPMIGFARERTLYRCEENVVAVVQKETSVELLQLVKEPGRKSVPVLAYTII